MDSFFGMVTISLCGIFAAGMIGSGGLILVLFIIGECHRLLRRRETRKIEELQKGFHYYKACQEIQKRERRLRKEKEAREHEDGEFADEIY